MSDNLIFDVLREPDRLIVRFSSVLELIDRAAEEVKILMDEAGLEKHSFGVRIVMREGLTNAVRHGNKNDVDKLVKFEIDLRDNKLIMIIEDEGEGFDWRRVKENCWPDENAGIPQDHGRGFPIMHEYFSEYSYNEKGNILILKKDISV